jgi:hypothetical protein
MKSILLTVRWVLEIALGVYLMVAAFGQILKSIMMMLKPDNFAYAFGSLVGTILVGALGYIIFRDGTQVRGRIRSDDTVGPKSTDRLIGK